MPVEEKVSDAVSIKVALRIRPLVSSETEKGCQTCLETVPSEPQVQICGTERSFTYNYVFGPESSQTEFYNTAVKNLVECVFKGYNVTILAYGQTGSGKTYSMGTCYNPHVPENEMGVIPRAIKDIFQGMEKRNDWQFRVTVSFMELYQEQLFDLLAPMRCVVDIREDGRTIKIPNLTEVPVTDFEGTVAALVQGSSCRATGATAMNAHSSRSHAIFTISIHQQQSDNVNTATTSKFHLVDLAGSERPKKTKATGERFKEGVNINKGLLALGNVISALGDETQKGFISYRDSKLTRLLQDSLGGNSVTLMIACVSPADYNLDETMSTLRYADRARNIKNKPIVNQDPKSAELLRLKQENQQLRLELLSKGGPGVSSQEFSKLKEEYDSVIIKNRKLTQALNEALTEQTNLVERALLAEVSRDKMKVKLCELQTEYGNAMESLNNTVDPNTCPAAFYEQLKTLKELQLKIQELQADQKRAAEEILNHELTNTVGSNNGDTEKCAEADSTFVVKTLEHQDDIDEHHEAYTLHQAALTKELQELNKALALKEELVTQLSVNSDQILNIRHTYEDNLKELEQQVAALQKEKDELTQMLKNMQTNSNTNKIAEQRRKKLQELEHTISELNKKISEQTKIIKIKEKSDEKISKLFNEIQNMKSTKVRLIRQMRAENERFRAWKQQKEKELIRLRDQDRRRQNQLERMERLHCKQQNVLKRKVEEAVAINKRLKDALALQKTAHERRNQHNSSAKVQQWIAQELEVLVSTVVAERAREQLLEDRNELCSQLSQLKENLEEEGLTDEERKEIHNEIKQLEEDVNLRSAQIADLQQKILDSDQENKAKTRWDTLQTMGEAKYALKYLFDLAADMKKDSTNKESRLEELMAAKVKLAEQLQNHENKLRTVEQEHKNELLKLEKEHADKVFLLLGQLKGVGTDGNIESDLMLRLEIQEQEIKKIEALRQQLERKEEEIADLKSKLEAKTRKRKTFGQADATFDLVEDFESDPEDDATVDDPNDPDWKKTPLFKRIQRIKTHRKEQLEITSKKESVGESHVKCQCRGKCASKHCRCKKAGDSCSEDCKCDSGVCVNRDQPRRLLFDFSNSSDEKDETVSSGKRSRLSSDDEISSEAKKRKSVRFFSSLTQE
ncbi:chromosome-associated kinesin KIF4A [Schistocerca piceifrons]|uniref:chromosome-associated kinesin KIF4A n=1 Tax=Schistocerca piceifrons TaxID=274613 RepID=UPI001F5E3D75|nr:chromosome-associated kinesin KIF4A [Schistocerca piceifrons]